MTICDYPLLKRKMVVQRMNRLFQNETFVRTACALHAGLVAVTWFAFFKLDAHAVNAKTWLLVALFWYPWLSLAVLKRGRNREQWTWFLCLCLLLLLPTMPTQYAFASWFFDGFAP